MPTVASDCSTLAFVPLGVSYCSIGTLRAAYSGEPSSAGASHVASRGVSLHAGPARGATPELGSRPLSRRRDSFYLHIIRGLITAKHLKMSGGDLIADVGGARAGVAAGEGDAVDVAAGRCKLDPGLKPPGFKIST